MPGECRLLVYAAWCKAEREREREREREYPFTEECVHTTIGIRAGFSE